MADMYTPEEIQAIFDAYNDAVRRGIPITEAMAKQMADATKGVKNYTDTLNISMNRLGQTTKQLGKDIANGAKGVSVFNDTLDAAGNAASNVASQFGPLGAAVGMVIKALTFFVSAATKQSDKLFETFQSISRTGAVGAQGMTDIFQSMKRFGYTIDELDKMTAVMAENSRDFALFGGTAATGGKRLSELVEGFQDARVNLQALGLSTDEQVRAAAGYYKQMGRLGRATDATSAGAVAYIKEMETLTRLTGLQRKELENQREAAEDIDAFYAALMDMDPKAANEAYDTFSMLMAQDPSGKKARAFANSINGIITGSEDQMQALFSTNFQLLDFATAVKEGRMSSTEFMQAYSDSTRQNIGLQKDLAKIGITDLMGGLKNNVIIANKGLKPFAQQAAEAAGQVEDLYNAVDPATKAQAEARVAQIDSSNAMQNFINLGVVPATKAMANLSKVIGTLTSFLPGSKSGGGAPAPASGGGSSKSLLDKIIGVESGGRNIGTTGSSAFGVGQMTKGTFEGLVRNAAPGSALYGKTFEDMKSDVGLQREALSVLTSQNQAMLGKAGVGGSDAATYLAHFLGAGGAIKVLSASSGTPLSAVVSPDAIKANPGVFGKMSTVDDLKAWADRKMGGGGYTMSGASGFRGSLSGPMSGYMPNMLMHGNEELSIRPMGGTSNSNAGASEGSIAKLIERVDDLIYVSKSQLSVNEKILKYQH